MTFPTYNLSGDGNLKYQGKYGCRRINYFSWSENFIIEEVAIFFFWKFILKPQMKIIQQMRGQQIKRASGKIVY
jgi:hypothetical protein